MEIYKINDEKFKSVFVSYNFTLEVKDTKDFSYFAVLGSLLAKSSQKYKNQKEIERYLNSLYGAFFDVSIDKLGDLYNLEYRAEYINKKFLPGKEDLTDRMIDFLEEVIYHPADWSVEEVEREKEFILQRIRERKDAKLKYGVKKMEELMSGKEPFGTFIYGDEEIVKKISVDDLKLTYAKLISGVVTVFISGNLEGSDDIDSKFRNKFLPFVENTKTMSDLKYNTHVDSSNRIEVETVKEVEDNAQSVVTLGYRLNGLTNEDYYVMTVLNGILGTTPSSKLFQNVREKESLAYTVSSKYYRFKNILIVFAGVNKENVSKAIDKINDQIDMIKNGDITDEEYTSAKDSILAGFLEFSDTKESQAKLRLASLVGFNNPDLTIEELRDGIRKVTMEDIVKMAKRISLEKIYILGGEEDA